MGTLQDQVESLLNVISYLLQRHDPSEIKLIDTKLFLNNFKKHIGIIEKCLGIDFGEMPTSNDDEESNYKEDTKECTRSILETFLSKICKELTRNPWLWC